MLRNRTAYVSRKHYEYKRKKYLARKERAFEAAGGYECRWCGATEHLQLDHIDETKKTISTRNLHDCSEQRFAAEIKNLQTLCIYCHSWKSNHWRMNRKPPEMDFNFVTGREAPRLLLEKWAAEDSSTCDNNDDNEDTF